MRLQRQLCLFLLSFLLSSSVSLSLDTFQDVKVSSCTCKFAITLTDDGLVDAKNSACNKKCTKKNLAATLGGPASVSNLYKIQFNVVRGSVTIVKLIATLVSASESSTPEPTTPEGTEGTYKPFPGFHPKGGPYCDRFVNECLDTSSYPNIGQAFRGYNLMQGDPLNFGGDPGFKGLIFDEAGERDGRVRFGNTAGNDLNRCDGSVRADFIQTSREFLESIMRFESSRKTFQIGSEVVVTAGLNAGLSGGLNGDGGGGGGGGVTVPVIVQQQQGQQAVGGGCYWCRYVPVTGNVGGNVGGSVGATVTIPPLYQSVSSNSKLMEEMSKGLESNQISLTRSSFSCYEYEFEITEFQHPGFTGQFMSTVGWLEACLLSNPQGGGAENSSIVEGTTTAQDKCAIKFFENYGTHYIRSARFGSKMSVLTALDSKTAYTANSDEVAKCAAKSKHWSLLGIIGGGTDKETCMEDLFAAASGSAEGVLEDIVITVGSRPKADYSDWAEQRGTPEIVHKAIAPISDLFNKHFMTGLSFEENGDASIKELLEKYLVYYCGLFRSQCNYVVAKPYCPHEYCDGISIGGGKCGHYTGSVDLNFFPHGHGTLTLEDEVAAMIWTHGCTADCVVHPYGSLPSGYHLASEDQVEEHKDWILETLEKWAIAKFDTGYIYGHGFGGQIIMEGAEVVNFKDAVICKNQEETTTPAATTIPFVKTFSFYKSRRQWVEAVQYCAAKGLRLAIISNVAELQRARDLVKRENEDVWLAGNDMSFESDWRWANGSLDDDWSTFVNAGGPVGLDFAWKYGSPHRKDDEDCLFMNDDGEFDDYECDKTRYILCDDGTDVTM